MAPTNDQPDAIIIGSGLAGLTVALTILDAGGRVVILEKEAKPGGNSMKASSGINAATAGSNTNDDLFQADTVASAGADRTPLQQELMTKLVKDSRAALEWLQSRAKVDVSSVAQLGGHQAARTYRPSGKLPIGAELMIKLQSELKPFLAPKDGEEATTICSDYRARMITNAKVTDLVVDDHTQGVTGVTYQDTTTQSRITLTASRVVLATGGFAAGHELLQQHRPDLVDFPTTAGPWSTGDGIVLAGNVKAGLVDMEHVQVHPTGFVDPKEPDSRSKFLAAEVLRGVGGILINRHGKRFCNELGRRDYVTEQVMLQQDDDNKPKPPTLFLLLSQQAAEATLKHVEFYVWKGFLTKVTNLVALAETIQVDQVTIRSTLEEYQAAAKQGKDDYGKTQFIAVPPVSEQEVYYVGKVTPVVHYCMGGVAINVDGHVLNTDGVVISGLYACGEVAGGVHGKNRLAGNSLCECVVYGRRVGQDVVAAMNKHGKL